jgi:ribosomal protein L7Ae-like RNA K-turn-binding protein
MIINNFKQLKPLIEKLLKEQKDQLLIICNDIEPDALASVLLNKIN